MAAKKKRSTGTKRAKTTTRKGNAEGRKASALSAKRPVSKSPGSSKAKARPPAARAAQPAAKKTPGKSTASRKAGAAAAKPTGSLGSQKAQSKAPAGKRTPPPTRRADTGPLTSSVGLIHGIPPYQPKAGEAYMNDRQREHFRNILAAWKRELMEGVDRTVHHMQDEASNFPDPNDRATQESEFGLELRTRDRERKLLKKIDSALSRIEDGSYGYCEETGEEIGLKRLEARPVATLSVEAQERREVAERQYRDREDGI